MRVEILNEDKDSLAYEQFVTAHPQGTFFQSLTWARYQLEAFGRKSFVVVVWENEQILCSSLCVIHRLSLGLSYIYAPRGPLLCQDWNVSQLLFQHIRGIASLHKAAFFLFDPLIQKQYFPDYRIPLLSSSQEPILRFKKSLSHQPSTTLMLDLRPTREEIFAQMREKGRYNIRLAERKQVIVRPGTVAELYPLLVETGKRDGFGIHPQRIYEKMADVFGDKALVLVAEYDREVVSGGIFLYEGELALYYYGASSQKHRNVMAPYLVQWQAILEGKRRGCMVYDFLGIADEGVENHALRGVTDFKKKFGGKVVEYVGAYRETYSAFWTKLYDLRHRRKIVDHDWPMQ